MSPWYSVGSIKDEIMPRTFSRGKKFSALDLWDVLFNHLSDEEIAIFRQLAIDEFCEQTEPGLESIDIGKIIETLLDLRKLLFNSIRHLRLFHTIENNTFSLSTQHLESTMQPPIDAIDLEVARLQGENV